MSDQLVSPAQKRVDHHRLCLHVSVISFSACVKPLKFR